MVIINSCILDLVQRVFVVKSDKTFDRKLLPMGTQRKKPLVNRSIIAWDIPWFVLKISKLMHSDYSHNYIHYTWSAVEAMISTQFSLYLRLECFNLQGFFCVGYLLSMAFCRMFYHSFTTITLCTRSEIHEFMITKPFF